MHEMSIAQNMLETLVKEQKKHKFSRVTRIHLRLGEFSNIVPESLSFCFDAVKESTLASESELIMDRTALRGTCTECRKEFDILEDVFLCPHCGCVQVAVISGEELDIVSIEVE